MTYRERKRLGLVRARPRRLSAASAAEIRTRYLRRECRQVDLAREYGVSQPTVARVVSSQVWAAPARHAP